jgi:hypothetical protein
VVALVVVGALIVAAGIAGSMASRADTRTDTRADAPPSVDCGQVPAVDCSAAVDAARDAVSDVPVRIVNMRTWPTLICGDDLDCPLPLLRATTPIGSVVVTFEDRGIAWINVFRQRPSPPADESDDIVSARVVRWFRAP